MNYKNLVELCRAKNLFVKDMCAFVGYSRKGLEMALDNETIELRKLKLLCDYLRVSPAQFFDAGTFGAVINAGGHVQSGNNNRMEVESRDREIELLRSQLEQMREQLRDKEEIINLLKSNHK